MIATSLGVLASLQPTAKGELAWHSVVPVVALGGIAKHSLNDVYKGSKKRVKKVIFSGINCTYSYLHVWISKTTVVEGSSWS